MKVSGGPVDVSPELWDVWAWCGEEGIKGLRGAIGVSELVVFRGLGAGNQNSGHGAVVGDSEF